MKFFVPFSTWKVQTLQAEVGKEISGFPELIGPVLAIIETTQLVCIHTQLRGGLSDTPVFVSTAEVGDRLYFDDFQPRP